MDSSIIIRSLQTADLCGADAILSMAFQSTASRLMDLQLYLQLQPDGWFVAEKANRLAGMVGAVSYGEMAHVGFMAVHPDLQHQGLGRALMTCLLAELDQKAVKWITLDASQIGQMLYEKLGFACLNDTLTFERSWEGIPIPMPADVEVISTRDLDEIAHWDAPIFGANRRKVFQTLLQAYPGRAFLQRENDGQLGGFVFVQQNRIGPWVARDLQASENLLKAALAVSAEEPVITAVPEENLAAVDLLQRSGFRLDHRNQHMIRGQGLPPRQRELIFAQTSLAVG